VSSRRGEYENKNEKATLVRDGKQTQSAVNIRRPFLTNRPLYRIIIIFYYAAFNAPCVGHKDDESHPFEVI